ncbi:MAG: hypothetical protein LBR26_03095 [Prevotella sp.]|jgi:hypothetical protein|nr:hypothetical protein [Prevotella sp.]
MKEKNKTFYFLEGAVFFSTGMQVLRTIPNPDYKVLSRAGFGGVRRFRFRRFRFASSTVNSVVLAGLSGILHTVALQEKKNSQIHLTQRTQSVSQRAQSISFAFFADSLH